MGDQERMLPRVVKLADRLAGEIGARGLEPGDRFLTAAEAAKALRVSMTLANRALQLLAQRGVIERRQRTGAVVAAPRSEFAAAGLARVAVFVPEADVVSEGLLEDGVIVGLQRALPGCSIGFHATGRNRDGDALEEMLRELGQQREPVAGAALLEGRGELQVLELEEHLRTHDLRERLGFDTGGVQHLATQPFGRGLDVDQRDRHGHATGCGRHVQAVPPTVSFSMRRVGWPTPTGTL